MLLRLCKYNNGSPWNWSSAPVKSVINDRVRGTDETIFLFHLILNQRNTDLNLVGMI